MTELTPEEQEKAFNLWRIKSGMIRFDESLKPFLSEEIPTYGTTRMSWLKEIRERLLLSRESIANKVGVSRQTLEKYEQWEEKGSITLATLERVAQVMDCELVYALRPKTKKLISALIWEKVQPAALAHPWLKKCDQRRRSEALVFVITRYLMNAKFRKKQGWSLRKNK